jgi:hypothetical protein
MDGYFNCESRALLVAPGFRICAPLLLMALPVVITVC